MTVYVEPSVFEETAERVGLPPDTWLAPAGAGQGQAAGNGGSSSSGSSSSGVSAFSNKGAGDSTAAPHPSSSSSSTRGAIVGSSWLRTWQPEEEGGVMIPECVASQLDLGVILGGDGTVLWTCYIFGNRSVPPLVPFSLGSLGFLTPFQPGLMKGVLARCLRGGFPIQLRHRLHCTIVRRQAGTAAAAAAASEPGPGGYPVLGACWGNMEGDERMALNEVVLDRGSSPFLSNLECFCDGSFVTHVQVRAGARGDADFQVVYGAPA
jgi:NAD+ kinase